MPRTELLEGRPHYVVPMVMLKVGVFNGSQGPLLYPADELGKTPVVWNGRPVVVYHPQLQGQGVSASVNPSVTDQYKVGTVFNAKFDGTRLVGEAWIDKERVGQVDDRVLQTIIHNRQMELSTGVFTDNEQTQGTWNGEPYIGIARNYRPDHLAILPDMKGACSIADGCGLIRNADNVMEPLGLPSTI